MSWIAEGENQGAIMHTLPGIGDRFLRLYDSFWALPHLPASVLELCRLRLAQLHESRGDWELEKHPVEPAKKAALRDWARDDRFSAGERACLAFTEVHAMDAGAITDAQAEAVKTHYGDKGLVALAQALGVFDGMIRLGLLWGLSDQAGGDQHGH